MTREKIEIAVRTLLSDLPNSLKDYWLHPDVLRTLLREDGFPGPQSYVLDNNSPKLGRSDAQRFGKNTLLCFKFGRDHENKYRALNNKLKNSVCVSADPFRLLWGENPSTQRFSLLFVVPQKFSRKKDTAVHPTWIVVMAWLLYMNTK